MAERRMMAKSVIETDLFMDMPMSTQCLYFHLLLRADDDGFIKNPSAIRREVGCSDDDMKLLLAKQFVLSFDTGVIVIRHWKVHNYIRKDMYHPTECQAEYSLLTGGAEKAAYVLKNGVRIGEHNVIVTESLQGCNGTVTDSLQACSEPVSIGKVRLGKVRLGKDSSSSDDDHDDDFKKVVRFFEENFSTVSGYTAEVLGSLIKDYSAEWVMHGMETCVKAGRQKCNIKYLEGVLKGWKADGIAKPWEQEGHHGRGTQKHSGRGGQKAGGYDADAERRKWEHETSGWD